MHVHAATSMSLGERPQTISGYFEGTLGARAALGVLWMRVHAAIGMYLGEHAQTISGNFQGIVGSRAALGVACDYGVVHVGAPHTHLFVVEWFSCGSVAIIIGASGFSTNTASTAQRCDNESRPTHRPRE